jgi:hypothetical protein
LATAKATRNPSRGETATVGRDAPFHRNPEKKTNKVNAKEHLAFR